MIDHKVVDIKITYAPESMSNVSEFEKKLDDFLDQIKGTKGVKIRAERHNVEVDVMLDEFGLETD